MTIEKKIADILIFFSDFKTQEAKYQRLMELGRSLSPLPAQLKTPENLVQGCQSELYLASRLADGKMNFLASSDALISAGLVALLLRVYEGETPKVILTTPPLFLKDLGILGSLSPSRSNGLAHIHQRLKIDALKFLTLSPEKRMS